MEPGLTAFMRTCALLHLVLVPLQALIKGLSITRKDSFDVVAWLIRQNFFLIILKTIKDASGNITRTHLHVIY